MSENQVLYCTLSKPGDLMRLNDCKRIVIDGIELKRDFISYFLVLDEKLKKRLFGFGSGEFVDVVKKDRDILEVTYCHNLEFEGKVNHRESCHMVCYEGDYISEGLQYNVKTKCG